jgi:hypothetical protein
VEHRFSILNATTRLLHIYPLLTIKNITRKPSQIKGIFPKSRAGNDILPGLTFEILPPRTGEKNEMGTVTLSEAMHHTVQGEAKGLML